MKKTKDPVNMKYEQKSKKNQVRVYRFLQYWNQLLGLLFRLNLRDPCAKAHGSNFASMLMFRFASHHILGSLSSFRYSIDLISLHISHVFFIGISVLFLLSLVCDFLMVSQSAWILAFRGVFR